MPAQDSPTPPSEPDREPAEVDPQTRLVLARLASGTSTLPDVPAPAATPRTAPVRSRLTDLGSVFFPNAPAGSGRGVGRLELAAFGAALLGATLIGVSLPHPQPVQARALVASTPVAAPVAVAPVTAAAPATTGDGSADDASADTASDTTAADDVPAAGLASTDTTAAATDDSTDAAASTDDPAAGTDTDDPAAGTDDPLGADSKFLRQVALIVVHGDAPVRWHDAAAGSPARKRAALGTTFTGFGQLPDAPLVTSLGLIAGQPSNPAARAGCDLPTPLVPGTLDAAGVAAGTGCDYPAGTPSLPTAVAVDGRRWKAYAPLTEAQAKPALCGVGAADPVTSALARTNALAHLDDLSSSGACEASAAPLTSLAADLASDTPPAWLTIDVGACGADGCDEAEAAARDRDLDTAITTLTAAKGLDPASAIFVVGDGAVAGLAPAEAGTVAVAPDDPSAPAAVVGGALLIGTDVAKDKADPLAIDPLAIAKSQATWLGLTPPGAADGATALARPGA